MLPDLVTRPFMIAIPTFRHYFHALHTPVALALIIIMLSFLFDEINQRKVILLLSLGTLTHLVLDSFQASVGDRGYSWLFPFSYSDFNFGLFWPEDSISILPFVVIIFLADYFISKKIKKSKVH
jgi:hypothetical protein